VGRELVRRLVGLRGRLQGAAAASMLRRPRVRECGVAGLGWTMEFFLSKSSTVLGLDLEIFAYLGL